ncbi:MAG: DUF1848 domain-containing protein [Deltaproteobacteria bacterium]|nr:DUF1848 domain-containing protein [Deltaproteobacteria bacterium]
MIVSCSRRADIPAFYPEWLMARLRAGWVLVPRPYNKKKLTEVVLTPETVDCLVFWTKNPAPLRPFLPEISALGFKYYFQFTLNPYDQDLEPGLPPKSELIQEFVRLSETIGPARLDWRYDPIILDEGRSVSYHLGRLASLGQRLAPYASRLITSWVDNYRGRPPFGEGTPEQIWELATGLGELGRQWRLPVYTCAEKMDLASLGIKPGSCLDRAKIEGIIGYPLKVKKDPGQRRDCLCVQSVDIGVYNTCAHLCAYCYATTNPELARRAPLNHNPASPSLGWDKRSEEAFIKPSNPETTRLF